MPKIDILNAEFHIFNAEESGLYLLLFVAPPWTSLLSIFPEVLYDAITTKFPILVISSHYTLIETTELPDA